MSQKHSILSLTTTVPENHFTFKWEVYNFSKTPGKLMSPPFSVAPGYPKDWVFSIECVNEGRVEIALAYLSQTQRSVRVFQKFEVCDSAGSTLKFDNNSRVYRSDGDKKFLICEMELNAALPVDVLRIRSEMKVYGYDIETDLSRFDDCGPVGGVLEFRSDMRRMMEGNVGTRIAVACKGKTFKIHECMLRFRVPKFTQIHAKELETYSVNLGDCDDFTFKSFMEYVYTGELTDKMTNSDAIKLYVLAATYDLKGLQRICSQYLMELMDIKTACKVLDLANTYSDYDLVERVKIFSLKIGSRLKNTPSTE